MKRVFLLMLLLPLSIALFATEAISHDADKKVNFGAKAGFTSTIFITSKFNVGNVKINQVQNNYKLGYSGSLFLRYNMKSHYIQPELVYVVNKGEIIFEKHAADEDFNHYDYASISSETHSFELPILYGYNFIKKDIYGMSFFVGPKLRYVWKAKQELDYINFDQKNIQEDIHPFNIGFTGGVAVYISKIFFDFRYEQILHNISKRVHYDLPEGVKPQGPMKLNRRDHMLSFSLGVIF